ncbi:unnamed protein product [Didymodactylos carnosus]|uniref:Uncharacterized protein n=1 Tax=Didymodactylos carnosus TaxID=1234261 RepID=A0A8S2CVT0_9BILA|nr:unnamed protein product [Didymodactylos carnosus]CAF3600056.1 unnamed protein product [Didymodactylos carnosus]
MDEEEKAIKSLRITLPLLTFITNDYSANDTEKSLSNSGMNVVDTKATELNQSVEQFQVKKDISESLIDDATIRSFIEQINSRQFLKWLTDKTIKENDTINVKMKKLLHYNAFHSRKQYMLHANTSQRDENVKSEYPQSAAPTQREKDEEKDIPEGEGCFVKYGYSISPAKRKARCNKRQQVVGVNNVEKQMNEPDEENEATGDYPANIVEDLSVVTSLILYNVFSKKCESSFLVHRPVKRLVLPDRILDDIDRFDLLYDCLVKQAQKDSDRQYSTPDGNNNEDKSNHQETENKTKTNVNEEKSRRRNNNFNESRMNNKNRQSIRRDNSRRIQIGDDKIEERKGLDKNSVTIKKEKTKHKYGYLADSVRDRLKYLPVCEELKAFQMKEMPKVLKQKQHFINRVGYIPNVPYNFRMCPAYNLDQMAYIRDHLC